MAKLNRKLTAAITVVLLICGCGADKESSKSSPIANPEKAASAFTPVGHESDPQLVRSADVSILFIGNSHTGMHRLPELVRKMIEHQQPGKSVYCHHIPVGFLDEVARHPKFRQELDSRPWKFVVLQAQKISMSGRYDYSRKEGVEFARLAKSKGATVLFYPEWGRKGVEGDGARQETVYREMARDAGVGVAPVARAWDLALAQQPGLELHGADGNHQSRLGAFLTARVLANAITDAEPQPLAPFSYEVGTAEQRRFLTAIASKARTENRVRTQPLSSSW